MNLWASAQPTQALLTDSIIVTSTLALSLA